MKKALTIALLASAAVLMLTGPVLAGRGGGGGRGGSASVGGQSGYRGQMNVQQQMQQRMYQQQMSNRYRYGARGGQSMQQSRQPFSGAPSSASQQQIMQREWLRQQQRLRDGSGVGQVVGAGGADAASQQPIQRRQGGGQGNQAAKQARQQVRQQVGDCPAIQAADVLETR